MNSYEFSTLKVSTPAEFVKHVELNRPRKRNAMNPTFWREIYDCFCQLSNDKDCRVVIISGAGKMFSAGLDITEVSLMMDESDDLARKAFATAPKIRKWQGSLSILEQCSKPVIAAIHGGCVGGGVDLMSACDIRYCTQDAWFQIKEVDLGLAADMGTLQRFPKIVGNDSLCRELVYTADKFSSNDAKAIGFVSKIFPNKEEMITATVDVAKVIASKGPVGVQGSKVNLIYSRDHSVPDSLEYQTTWSSAMLHTEDVVNAVTANMKREKPLFSKL